MDLDEDAGDDAQFKPGDVVKLKSGGPKMTVQKTSRGIGDRGWTVRCDWFAGSKKEQGVFAPEQLVHFTEAPATGE